MLKIKSGDEIIVISGKYKGYKGKVLNINVKQNKALINDLYYKNIKIIHQEYIIFLNKIALIDTISGKPTKIEFKFKNGIKYRIAKKSGTEIKYNIK